jgi:hypothetical protein
MSGISGAPSGFAVSGWQREWTEELHQGMADYDQPRVTKRLRAGLGWRGWRSREGDDDDDSNLVNAIVSSWTTLKKPV